MLRVIGAALFPWVRRVLVVLEEKEIEFEHEPYFPFGEVSEDFKRKSPLKLVPVLETDEGPLADSSAICAYIEARYPRPSLLPDDPFRRGRAVWMGEYADALFKHEGTIFFQMAVTGHLLGKSPDLVAVEEARAKIPPFLEYLDGELVGRRYFCGHEMNLGDITVASVLLNYMHAGEAVNSDVYPNLVAFLDRMFDRESFRKRIREDLETLAGLSTVEI